MTPSLLRQRLAGPLLLPMVSELGPERPVVPPLPTA